MKYEYRSKPKIFLRKYCISWNIILYLFWISLISVEAQPVYNSNNNHYYEIVITDDPISWYDATKSSEMKFFNGNYGYLATITTTEELHFILSTLFSSYSNTLPDMWIGAFQAESHPDNSEGWKWITGELFNVTNRLNSESDDLLEHNVLAMLSDGTWHSLSPLSSHLNAYLVEYDPTRPLLDPIWIPWIDCNEDLRVQGHYQNNILDLELELNVKRSVEWNAWLIQGNETVSILSMNVVSPLNRFSPSNQLIEMPISLPSFPPQGVVGVLTTISTLKQGIICSKLFTVNTSIPFMILKNESADPPYRNR